MNRKIFNKLNISKFMNMKNNQIIFLIIMLVLLSALIFASYLLFFNSETPSSQWLRGTVYINGEPAPPGINVSVISSNSTIYDGDGTNETGYYEIEVTDFIGESFDLYIIYQGNMYLGSDENGLPLSLTITDDMDDLVDIFVLTEDEDVDDEDDSDDADDSSDTDDDTDDSGEDDGSEDSEDDLDDEDDSDDADDGSDTDDDTDDDTDGDDSSDDDTDDSDDDDTEDEDDDEPSEDEDTENESTYLSVEKTVWENLEGIWSSSETIELGGSVQFNITVIYNGSNLSEIEIIDKLPEGLSYDGDATVNGSVTEPEVNQTTNVLQWNLPASSNQNTTIYVTYNTTVDQRHTLQNNVTVNLIKNETTLQSQVDDATVQVYGELNVSKTVRNRNETLWNQSTQVPLDGFVRFNITVWYNGTNAVSNISIMDKLPEGIDYYGNATLNGESISPGSPDDNRTLFWNYSLLNAGEQINIEFDANISKNATVENTVQVWGNETLGKQFDIIKMAAVTGSASQLFICEKTIKVDETWENSVDAFVGDTITFNVTVTNLDMNVVTYLAILDTFPSGLEYVDDSSVIYFENKTYYREPSYHEETNTYIWINFNEIIQGYFNPNDTITLQYDAIILKEGIHHNLVEVNSSVCGDCYHLTGFDSATVSATTEFTVKINVPEPVYTGEKVTISAEADGGEPPYEYSWDLDDDGDFDDEQSPLFTTVWNETGKYPISVKVSDNTSEYKEDTVIVNVTVEPLSADANGPYEGYPDENISFEGSASGGIGNYSWFWNFGDGNVSTVKDPKHAYAESGVYYVRLNVTDERNVSVIETTTATIIEPDHTAPSIEFEAPINAIYIRGRPVFPFFRPLVFGSIEINVTAEDEQSSIDLIEIYIEDQLVESENGNSACYDWNETEFGRRTITVKAVNSEGIEETEERVVWKFF